MRRRLTIATGIATAVALAVGAYLAFRPSGFPSSTTTPAGEALAPQTASVGEITVEVEPVRVDGTGAEFHVTLDTHSGALDLDMTTVAQLEVDGVAWPVVEWSGDGPGGHHRQGRLTFGPGGPPSGTARLTIAGLPEPLQMTWDITG